MSSSVLLIDKPKGMTSHDVVDVVRRVTGERRVGHAGTLDPMATGLLIILVGREATKRQAEFMGLEKEYEAEITFGAVSDTYDGEGRITTAGKASPIPQRPNFPAGEEKRQALGISSEPASGESPAQLPVIGELAVEDIEKILGQFLGVIKQQVPPYAAVKIRGKKLYEYARAGQLDEIKIPVRKVKVKRFELLYFLPVQDGGLPKAGVRVVCSKGTYIRSLAHDLGQKLGVGAYLSALRRTRIGPYRIEDAASLNSLVVE